MKDCEITQLRIESCLEDTCMRILEDTKLQKQHYQEKISDKLQSLKHIYLALDRDEEFHSLEESIRSQPISLARQLDMLLTERTKILPSYESAIARMTKIIKEAKSILNSMELPSSTLGSNLATVINAKLPTKRRGFSLFVASFTVRR